MRKLTVAQSFPRFFPSRRNSLSDRSRYQEVLAWCCCAPLLLWLVLFNLGGYPTMSGWDEGMYLQFARNVADHGEYATRNGATFERLTPVGGTGPTLIGPVALALKLSNGSFIAARLVVVGYLMLALLGAYVLIRQIAGWRAAILAFPLFLTAGFATYDTLWMGRQVLAELPAFAFMVWGVYAWWRCWQGSVRWLALSAVLFAAAVVTKNQLIWVLGPALALVAFADFVYYRQLRWPARVLPLAGIVLGYGVWSAAALWIVGADGRERYLATQQALAAASFFHVSLQRVVACARLFMQNEQWPLVLVAIAAMGYGARKRTRPGLQRLTLASLTTVALANFLLVSLPWARYLYPVCVLAAVCSGVVLGDLIAWAQRQRWGNERVSTALALLVVVLLGGPRLVRDAHLIATTNDTSAAQFAALIDQQTPSNARIANWEWEVEWHTERAFLHPPHILFAAQIDDVYNNRRDPILRQPRIPADAEYVVVGPFASQTQVFAAELAQQPHTLLAQIGSYQLYRLNQ